MMYKNNAMLQLGELVWYLSTRKMPGEPKKLTKQWTVPWRIEERVGEVLYRNKPHNNGDPCPTITVHAGRIQKFN